jgi:putative membrane protein insertion efficiency factor
MKRFRVSFFGVGLVRLYQWTIRPIIGPRCRFLPHCSDYAIEAFEEHGLFSGAWLSAKRLCRCHPWCDGGLDLVPRQHHRQPLTPSAE